MPLKAYDKSIAMVGDNFHYIQCALNAFLLLAS